MKQDLEELKDEAHRILKLLTSESGFVARNLSDLDAIKIAAAWHSFITEPKPSYALSSSGAIVNGIFEELARCFTNVRSERARWIMSGKALHMFSPEPYPANEEGDLGSLIVWCAGRVNRGEIGPVPGWTALRW